MPASDDEPVDKYVGITEECKPKCKSAYSAYEACLKRVEKKNGGGDCEPWYFDYWKCIDKCRVPQLMKTLK